MAIYTTRQRYAGGGRRSYRGYHLASWQKRRAHLLRNHPLCAICLAKGVPTAAVVADHIRAHRGDPFEFWHGALQSLCQHCHNSIKQREEARAQDRGGLRYEANHGWKKGFDYDGTPIDPRHPFNEPRGRAVSRSKLK
jgi:5-methylcytosine-specific restriction enzyme A